MSDHSMECFRLRCSVCERYPDGCTCEHADPPQTGTAETAQPQADDEWARIRRFDNGVVLTHIPSGLVVSDVSESGATFKLAKLIARQSAPSVPEGTLPPRPELIETFGGNCHHPLDVRKYADECERQLLGPTAQLAAERDKVAAAEREAKDAKRAREHTWGWIGSHYAKLEDWARKRLPEPWRNEFFSCIANGTYGHQDTGEPYICKAGFQVVPSGYIHMEDAKGQMYQDQMRRAEDAEARAERAEAESKALRDAYKKAREAVLHQRNGIAENGMTGEQVNDVLGVMDDAFSAALATKDATPSDPPQRQP